MEEVDEVPIIATTSTASGYTHAPTDVPAAHEIPVVGTPEVDYAGEEGWSLFQKGLFFAVIVGCVVIYMKMGRERKVRYQGKSLA